MIYIKKTLNVNEHIRCEKIEFRNFSVLTKDTIPGLLKCFLTAFNTFVSLGFYERLYVQTLGYWTNRRRAFYGISI